MFKSRFLHLMYFFLAIYTYTYLSVICFGSTNKSLFIYSNGVFFSQNVIQRLTTFSLLFTILVFYLFLFSFFVNKNLSKTNKNKVYLPYLTILIGSLLLINSDNLLLFVLAYETILIPSAFLLFMFSPNKRSFVVTVYFLLWTQFGSFMVLIGSFLLYNHYTILTFSDLYLTHNNIFNTWAIILLFLGFGIKIPVWPFHFWLTKTHVEANTSFSVFLSGILVKTALVGFIKFNPVYTDYVCYFLCIVFFGLLDTTFKLPFQTDFKKLIAFLTVQEMSLLLVVVFFLDTNNSFILRFSVLHTFLSGSLFYLNEFLYCRRGTRQLQVSSGFLNDKPLFSFFFYTTQLLFIGIPFTLKFFVEINLITKLLSFDVCLFVFFFIFLQFLTVCFFFKSTIFFFFGQNTKQPSTDLTSFEVVLLFSTILPLTLLPLF